MKKLCLSLALAGSALPALAGTDVGVSIGIGQPGLYGRIDIGRVGPPVVVYPQPVLVYPQPVLITPPVAYRPPPPMKPWRPYAPAYGTRGGPPPVVFVRDGAHGGWRHAGPHRDGRHDERHDRRHGRQR